MTPLSNDALAALATLYCSISTTDPQEQQVVEKMIHALEDSLEETLLKKGWKLNSESAVPTGEDLSYFETPKGPGVKVNKIRVPGVPMALQLFPSSARRAAAPQVETQLYFGNWNHSKKARGNDACMVVHIRATTQVTAELLKKIDWSQVGNGLTQHSNRL